MPSMPRGSGHIDLSQRPRREAPGMLTGMAILERELGLLAYEEHRLRRELARRPAACQAAAARSRLAELRHRRGEVLGLLDEWHASYEERVMQGVAAQRARAARSPRVRRESPEEARRRLGIGR